MKKCNGAQADGQGQQLTAAQRALIAAPASQRLARAMARRTWALSEWNGADMDELMAEAEAALVAAALRFDPSRGVHFAAFATPRIRGQLLRAAGAQSRQRRFLARLALMTPDAVLRREPQHLRAAELRRLLAAVMQACRALPVDHARLIEGHYLQGISMRTLARELGRSYKVTLQLRQDALARLRHHMILRGMNMDP